MQALFPHVVIGVCAERHHAEDGQHVRHVTVGGRFYGQEESMGVGVVGVAFEELFAVGGGIRRHMLTDGADAGRVW